MLVTALLSSQCRVCNRQHEDAGPSVQTLGTIQWMRTIGEVPKESPETLGTIQRMSTIGEAPKESPESEASKNRLMYIPAIVNGPMIRVLVDSGATHHFITPAMAKECGLKVEMDSSSVMKAVNSAAKRVSKRARNVLITVGESTHKAEFSVVEMDDFEIALGQSWLKSAKAPISPF
eukprot:c13615_g4_i1 orf=760-1290(+)